MANHERLFPYMVWAHEESFRSPFCLAQSGMPAPASDLLADVGPPDLAPPAAEALPLLKQRLGELFAVDPGRVLVTLGASGAMLVAAMRLFRPGARVVCELPSYEPFRALPRLFGAQAVPVERSLEARWRFLPEDFERAASGAKGPVHAFLSNPNNPTGALLPAETLSAVAELAGRSGGLLISNEVYMEYAPNAERVHAFALAPNALSIGSLTKAYGLGALRIGWIVAGEQAARELGALEDMAYLAWVDPPTPSLVAARHALGRLEPLIARVRELERDCRPLLANWLAQTPGVEGLPPELGLAAFARLEGVEDTVALQRYLAAEWDVDVVPGEFFGLPGHVRVSYGVPQATLREGLERLAWGIEAFRCGAR